MHQFQYYIFQNGRTTRCDPNSFSFDEGNPTRDRVYTTITTHTEDNSQRPGLAFFHYHLERLVQNAKELGFYQAELLEHDTDWVRKTVWHQLRLYAEEFTEELPRIRVRLIFNTTGFELSLEPYHYPWADVEAIDVIFVQKQRPLPSVKSTNIDASLFARREAEKQGAHEALLVNDQGFVTEGAFTNVFWFDQNGQLLTPRSQLLAGVTRCIILENFRCSLCDIRSEELQTTADEIFVTQSTGGVIPVARLDGKRVGRKAPGAQTLELRTRFEEIRSEATEWI